MSDFYRQVVEDRLTELAAAADSPQAFAQAAAALIDDAHSGGPGNRWIARQPEPENPDSWPVEAWMCCSSAAVHGPARCLCWEPVYDVPQATPQPPAAFADLEVNPGGMCADCAYRKGSPERSDDYAEETLLDLPARGELFFCHTGMRRPVAYIHPTLGSVDVDPSDYTPPIAAGIPYRADGQPGYLCAGWVARADRLR